MENKTYVQGTSRFTEKDLTPSKTPLRDKINQGMSLEDAIQSEVVKVTSITISQKEYDRLLAIESEVKKLVPLIQRML